MNRIIKPLVVVMLLGMLFCSCSLENKDNSLKFSRPQSKWLSPNTNAISTNNDDNSITVKIYYNNHFTMWTGSVSQSSNSQITVQDYSYGSIILRNGAKIELVQIQPGMYDVILTCTIYDNRVDYRFSGVVLGTWYF